MLIQVIVNKLAVEKIFNGFKKGTIYAINKYSLVTNKDKLITKILSAHMPRQFPRKFQTLLYKYCDRNLTTIMF